MAATRISVAISTVLLIPTVKIKVTTSLAAIKLTTARTALAVSLETTAVVAVTAIVIITSASSLMTTIATIPFITMKMIAVAPTLVKRQNDYH